MAANGSLVYVTGEAGGGGRQTVVSVDRQGRSSPLPGLPLDAYRTVRVSPDGTRLALATAGRCVDLRFCSRHVEPADDRPRARHQPALDARRPAHHLYVERAGYPELFWRQADGTGSDERLLGRAKDLLDLLATGWSKDGRQLLFSEVPPSIQCAIGQITSRAPVRREAAW